MSTNAFLLLCLHILIWKDIQDIFSIFVSWYSSDDMFLQVEKYARLTFIKRLPLLKKP